MAVRQYVGARYVPKFYQNSQNPQSSEWEGNVAYEALTVVTYNNSSYTSKIPVPAGIGNPASNPTYWVVTGAYNAQVDQYRREVETTKSELNDQLNEVNTAISTETTSRKDADTALQERLNTLEKEAGKKGRTFLLMGDSYAQGYTPDVATADQKGWYYWVKQFLETKGYTVIQGSGTHRSFNTGYCFGADDYSKIITDLLEAGIINDETYITDIIIYEGTNEYNQSASAILTGMTNLANLIKEHWPYANVKVGFFSRAYSAQTCEALKQCGQVGFSYITGSDYLCCDTRLLATDTAHLSQDGYKFYSQYLASGALDGSMSYEFTFSQKITGDIITGDYYYTVIVTPDNVHAELYGNYGCSFTYTYGTGGQISVDLGTYVRTCLFGNYLSFPVFLCYAQTNDVSQYAFIKLHTGSNRVQLTIYTPTGTAYCTDIGTITSVNATASLV